MRRRHLLTAAGAGLAALALRPGAARAYGDFFTAVGNTLDELRARGSAKVAWYTDFFPFSYQTADGWAGIDVDLARHVTAALGVSLQPVPVRRGRDGRGRPAQRRLARQPRRQGVGQPPWSTRRSTAR